MNELSTLLTAEESSALVAHEAVVQAGLKNFMEVGAALASIKAIFSAKEGRESASWRSIGYDNWRDYCQNKWGISRMRAFQLIEGAEMAENVNLGLHSPPESERQIRPLAQLTPPQQVEAWGKANEATGGKPTARDVQAAVDQVKGAIVADEVIPPAKPERMNYKPCDGLMHAGNAISQMAKIHKNDTERSQAFEKLQNWINQNK